MAKHFSCTLILLLALLAGASFAQGPSAQPIRIVFGFPPGGQADATARVIAREASKLLQRPIIIESKVGAGGAIGAESVANARPDGTTLLLATTANAILPALKNLPYKAVDDFEWIGTFTRYPLVVAASRKAAFDSLESLLAQSRKSPGQVSYGSAGVGSAQHLVGELLAQTARVKFLHVAYKGEPPAVIDLLADRIQFVVLTAPSALPRIQSGELRPLAVTGKTRWAALPMIPTVEEAGYPDFDVTSWLGLAAPRGTPLADVARLNKAFLQAQSVPEVQRFMEAQGAEPYTLTPAQTRELVESDVRRWKDVVKRTGVSAE